MAEQNPMLQELISARDELTRHILSLRRIVEQQRQNSPFETDIADHERQLVAKAELTLSQVSGLIAELEGGAATRS